MTRRARRQPTIITVSPPRVAWGRPAEPDMDSDTGPAGWWSQVETRMQREQDHEREVKLWQKAAMTPPR